MTERSFGDSFAAAAVFVAALVVYLANGEVQPGIDPTANVELPARVLEHGRLTFSPRESPHLFFWRAQDDGSLQLSRPGYYLIASTQVDADGEPLYVNSYGLGSGLTALPVYAVARALGSDLAEPRTRWRLGKLAAALSVAGAVALAFLIARFRLGLAPGLWVAAAVGLGTSAWSSSSQTLWQHGPNELFLMLGTWALLHPSAAPWLRAVAGASYAWAAFCRPTSIVVLGLAGIHLLVSERRSALAYGLGAAPLMLALAGYNAYYQGSPFNFGQLAALSIRGADEGLWSAPFWTSFAGQLLSPSRGLLVYSPILAAAFGGMWVAWRTDDRAFRALSVIALVLLCADMKWFNWWGGWSYGYRLKVDAAVLLTLLLIPVMPQIMRHVGMRLAFLFALVWSVAVQALGAWAYDFDGWNNRLLYRVTAPGLAAPVVLTPDQVHGATRLPGVAVLGPVRANVDDPAFRYRLWSLGDSQILYYASHFSEARANKHRLLDAMFAAQGPRIVPTGSD